MSCEKCKHIQHSYRERPFDPVLGDIFDKTYICSCGQKWWQMNTYFHLWSMVNDDATWDNILGGCKEPVGIGQPSINLK